MNELCAEHKNKIERICLHADCQARALCLLCDHHHGNPFQSIMVKKSQSYKTFQLSINEALDKFVLQKKESTEEQVLSQQLNMIQKYFEEMKIQMNSFLKELQRTISMKLQSDQQQNFMQIKKARINKNYLKVDKKVFQILMEIYEGTPLSDIFKNSEGSKGEQVYQYMKSFHDQITQILEKRSFKLKAKLPDLRKVYLQERSNVFNNEDNYDIEQTKKKYKVKLIKQFQPEIDSILTDCKKSGNKLFVTCYDKKLRIFDKQLDLKTEFQFSNILTKIHQIADDVFAIGHSKEIYIENIKMDQNEYKIENIMKLRGHTQKINDLHCLNSRIIGSSSSESVKIWDLYKQKCEYTLTDQANPTTIRFLPVNNTLAVGFNNHFLKLYEIQTMKVIKKYNLNGVPLMIDQGKFTSSQFYVGAFDSSLFIADMRLNKMANQIKLKQGAITCIYDSLFDSNAVAVGDRNGHCNIIDLKSQKVRASWLAHEVKTNMSKPRGVLSIFENEQNMWTTIGCNDKTLKLWEVKPVQGSY